MQILYLDSLDVDEVVESKEVYPIRAAAWNDKLIQAVMRKDAKGDGEFGKLKVSTFLPIQKTPKKPNVFLILLHLYTFF